jgi:hypothetical protein
MDKAVFIKELRDLFSNLNKKEHRYSIVWLSDETNGGLYRSGKYALRVKMARHLVEFSPEIKFILHFLSNNLNPEKLSYIFNLDVYNDNEDVSPDRGDITLYTDEVAYNAA